MIFPVIAILFCVGNVVRGGINKLPDYCQYYTTLTRFGSSRKRIERPSNTDTPTMEEEVTIVEVTNVTEQVEVSLPDIIVASFEPDTFNASTTVTVREVTEKAPEVSGLFSVMTFMHQTVSQGDEIIRSEEIYIEIPGQVPLTDFVDVTVNIPNDISDFMTLLTESGEEFGFQLFVSCQHGGSQVEPYSIFILLPSLYNEIANTLNAQIPSACFNPNPFDSDENVNVAILSMSLTPGSNDIADDSQRRLQDCPDEGSDEDSCEAVSIDCPLQRGCTVTSPYDSEARNPHFGVDFEANAGDNVTAAADGRIKKTKFNVTLGNYIVLRHTDQSATLYAHLESFLTIKDAEVLAGDVIATVGSTGRATEPHLHFEYVPSGKIINSNSRIDPFPCIGRDLEGSITVSDAGADDADDAFEVYVDGVLLGRTEIGASNSLAINNLRPGEHTLELLTYIAPDDVGTYMVTLRDGWTFEDGSQSKTYLDDVLNVPGEGETRTWIFFAC